MTPPTFAERIVARNHVRVTGEGATTLLLAHGFGCDQTMWRFVLPELARHYRVVTFDYVGCGKSRLEDFLPERYATLNGYATDLLEVVEALQLHNVVIVGHSVSTMIGLIAAAEQPEAFAAHVMVCPSPSFLNDGPYPGGFEYTDLTDLLDLMDKNFTGWADLLAPLVMGQAADREQVNELHRSFCQINPVVARTFARATFLSDHRALLPAARHPALILQSRIDALAPPAVGRYMAQRMPQATLHEIDAEGHCLHMSHPEATVAALQGFVRS